MQSSKQKDQTDNTVAQIDAFAAYVASVVHGRGWAKGFTVEFQCGERHMNFNSNYREVAGLHIIHFLMDGGDSSYFTTLVADKHVATPTKMRAYIARRLAWYFDVGGHGHGEWMPPSSVSIARDGSRQPSRAQLRMELDPDSEMYAYSCGIVARDL